RTVLEEVGVTFPSDKALKIFADVGAYVDFDNQLVKIPADLLDKYLATSPRSYTMAGVRPDLDVQVGSDEGTYFYCSGEAPKIVDFETGERRLSVKKDIANHARIADYLPIVSLLWPSVSSSDKGVTSPIHGLEACFNSTEKHVETESVMDAISARYAVKMATAVAGSEKNLRERPTLSQLLCCIAPLAQDRGGIEAAMVFAEHGIPVGFMSMPTLGLTAPPYPAGALTLAMAETLSGIMLTQIINPGVGNYISVNPGIIDPRTGVYFMSSGIAQITNVGSIQMAHSNGIPVLACHSFGGSQYELGNWQVGYENLYSHFLAVMAGADMSFGPSGMYEAVSLLDHPRILFDREIIQTIDEISDGMEVNSKTLSFDMIKEIGQHGSYISLKETAKETRSFWRGESILFEDGKAEGRKWRDPVDVAREAIRWILENHNPEPLSADVKKELRSLVEAADVDEDLTKEVQGRKQRKR
ncbi:MAG: trimethylamine methyltransferase family protein, partial [Anaerolineales bacterium]|nr:trimethylamine methyltransferase family protein [Anaerolineales bacterium]